MTRRIGAGMAAAGVHQGLCPVLDHRWARVEKAIGEDPYLVGVIGTAYVRGLESAGVGATLTHFAGYSASRAARDEAPVPTGPRELRDAMLMHRVAGSPGEAGDALLGTGTVPSGKLFVQIPGSAGAQPHSYPHPVVGGHSGEVSDVDPSPAFPFGHGLSYTAFAHDDSGVSAEEAPTNGEVDVSRRAQRRRARRDGGLPALHERRRGAGHAPGDRARRLHARDLPAARRPHRVHRDRLCGASWSPTRCA